MKFLLNNYKKHIAAVATAIAAIAIPAQATDCPTYCKNVAGQAGYNAAKQAEKEALAYCTAHYVGQDVNSCMNGKVPQIQAAYDQAYQQTYASCMSSCH